MGRENEKGGVGIGHKPRGVENEPAWWAKTLSRSLLRSWDRRSRFGGRGDLAQMRERIGRGGGNLNEVPRERELGDPKSEDLSPVGSGIPSPGGLDCMKLQGSTSANGLSPSRSRTGTQ